MSSAPLPSDLLQVLVLDADPEAVRPLIRALQKSDRTAVEYASAYQLTEGIIDPVPDLILFNVEGWARGSATAEAVEKALRPIDWQDAIPFTRAGQQGETPVPQWLAGRDILVTAADPMLLQAQVDRIVRDAWRNKESWVTVTPMVRPDPAPPAAGPSARPPTGPPDPSSRARVDDAGVQPPELPADGAGPGVRPAAGDTVQVQALYSGLPTDVDVAPSSAEPRDPVPSKAGASTVDLPAADPAEALRSTGPLPLSASAQPAVRNAAAYHRAAPRMPMSIALLAGIVSVAQPGHVENAWALQEDTASLLYRFLRVERPRARDIDLLGLGAFGITRQPAPLPPFADLAIDDRVAQAELRRIVDKASRYARRVYPQRDPVDGPPLFASVRHLLAALVTDDEPAFPVPAHLEAQGYSVAALRAELLRFFSTLTERTDAWREILRPLDVLTRAEPASGSPVEAPPAEPSYVFMDDGEEVAYPDREQAPPAEPSYVFMDDGEEVAYPEREQAPPAEPRYVIIDDGEEMMYPDRAQAPPVPGESEEEEEEEFEDAGDEEPLDSAPRALRFASDAPAAAYDSDSATGADLLNLTAEVNALSAVLASKELQPPLSVGLFGDWGTGKSFFMELMRRRIRQLSRDARVGRTDAFCPRIVQITFNAWHYMDANLWASLVSGVFDGLARALSTREDRPAAVRERLLARMAEKHVVLAQAEQRKRAAEDATRRAQEKLQQVERQKSGLRAVLGSGRDVITVAVRQPEVTARLVGLAQDVGLPESTVMNLGAHREALESRAQRLRVMVRVVTGREGDRRRLLLTALFAVLIIGLGFLGWWLVGQVRGASTAVQLAASALGALIGLGTQVAAQLRPLYRKLASAAPRLREIVRQAETLADDAGRRMDEPAAEARSRLSQLEAEETAAREAHVQAVRQVQEVDEEIQEIRAGRRLHRFISERSAAQDYRRHLGIVALVRDDFQRLSRLLGEARTGADGELPPVDRIVLYIDDLDRCPEKRVVEVLQAVHLLLAFPLFVVVVGVDSRWLLRSVRRHYAQLVDGGAEEADAHSPEEWASTPQNYLEKIFQIPFTLRPMASDEYAALIRGLVPLPGDEAAEAAGDADDGEWVDFPDETVAAPLAASSPATPSPASSSADAAAAEPVSEDRAPADAVPPAGSSAGPFVAPPAADRVSDAPDSAAGARSDGPGAGEDESEPRGVPGSLGTPPAGVRVTGAKGSAGTAERAARAAVRAAEQGLAMERHERQFLQALSALIPSPRSAKRLVNVYRFIRASLDPTELASFVGTGAGSGDHQCVALLLAVVTGFPTQSVDLFRALDVERADAVGADWWTFFEGIAPREVDVARWEPLRQALRRVRQKVPGDLPLEPFVRWAPHVARFSFQTGQLFARRHG